MQKISQKTRILNRLRLGVVTNIELNEICFRYAARISELKKEGHDIQKRRVKGSVFEWRMGRNISPLIQRQNERLERERAENEKGEAQGKMF